MHWERGEPKSAGGGAREGVEKNYAERGASKKGPSVPILGSLALPRPRPPNNYMWISVLKHTEVHSTSIPRSVLHTRIKILVWSTVLVFVVLTTFDNF